MGDINNTQLVDHICAGAHAHQKPGNAEDEPCASRAGRAAKEEGARQGHRANGQATMTNGGVSAVISAMTERSRAIGSSAADLLQKEADARRSSGALEHPVSCCRSSSLLFWKACWLSCCGKQKHWAAYIQGTFMLLMLIAALHCMVFEGMLS